MDSKELRGLMEAYSEVYAPQEVDEGLRSAVKRLLGGGKKEAEAPKPESRGAELRRRYNVGPEKSDTSAKRQILNRSRARAERDERDYGSSKYSKSVAQQSKAAHDRYLKAGYSKYGADLKHGSGNKARKRAAALNREEFEFIVNALIEEGYDLSSYTWDEMYEICLDEALTGERYKKVMKKPGGTAYSRKVSADPSKRAKRGGKGGESDFGAGDRGAGNKAARRAGTYQEELDIFDEVLEFLQVEGYAETLEEAEWMMANIIDEEAIDIILGEEQLDEISVELARRAVKKRQERTDDLMDLDTLGQTNKPSTETEISHNKLDDNKRRLRKKIQAQNSLPTPRAKLNAEEVDIYDIILSHLLDEGYAETPEAAEAIMVNMSEEWRDDIMEISDRKVKAVRNAREKQWNKQFGKNRVQDPTDDMVDKVDKLIDQRNKRTGSKVKKTTMGQLGDKLRDRGRW